MKKKVIERILLTVIGIPIFLSSIFFFPQANYLMFLSIILFFNYHASKETVFLIQNYTKDQIYIKNWMFVIIPILYYIYISLEISGIITIDGFSVLIFLIVLMYTIICEMHFGFILDNFQRSIYRILENIFVFIYPTLFTFYIFKITALESSSLLLIIFFLFIFSNDVFAYIFGMLFGRKTKGILKVSPNKSAVGYAGGVVTTIAISYLIYIFFHTSLPFSSYYTFFILTLLISFTSHLGDLFESLLKRSTNIKDSGNLIPGRGGFLDTIDSIVFSAPFFYFYISSYVFIG
ncbi:MAG: phosphatidate cytidylyltransferase [Spirochaetia bacterium]|nr:phosphatidate cytidylyltransferase [Spirochaetia bacterium]MCF7946905.1 phosphatidate cytidylyltransferase [Spirochaetia bacterium]